MQQPSPKTEIRDGCISYVALPLATLPPGTRVRLQQLGTRACELRRELDQLPAATSKSEAAKLKGDYAALQVELGELDAELRARYGAPVRRPLLEPITKEQHHE